MAETLAEYLVGKTCKGFVSQPHYNHAGDHTTHFFSDEVAYEDVVGCLTVYRSMVTHGIVGYAIPGKVVTEELQKLIEAARTHRMTAEEQEAQQISFAYGNVNLHNPTITREDIIAAAERLVREQSKNISQD